MKVENMTSPKGNKVVNQFIIEGICELTGQKGLFFQSYCSVIAFKPLNTNIYKILIDKEYWDYSTTTGKYRNIFLGETKKETEKKIKSGEYILTDLN